MPKPRNTNKKYLGVTLKDSVPIVEQYAQKKDWSYSQAADRLVKLGAESIGFIQTKPQVQK